MSESLDVNRKMVDEYMRLRDVATTWKQKAKTNSKDAKDGRKARDELFFFFFFFERGCIRRLRHTTHNVAK